MIDLHCHVLPGIDDGPETIEGSVVLARAAAAAGIETIVATPHVNGRYRNDSATIAGLVDELNGRLRADGVAVEIRAGAEIAITRAAEIDPRELERLSLGGGPWLLIEPPFVEVAAGLEAAVRELQRQGHLVLLAHPERCPAFHRDPEMLEAIVAAGALTSITAGSLSGQFGSSVRRFALELVGKEMVHNVTSDAHDPDRRPPGIAPEIEQAGLGQLREWLTRAVPAAILAGAEIPPRPDVSIAGLAPRRGRWPRRLRPGL
jgi:protein-tyrosine phosphatase